MNCEQGSIGWKRSSSARLETRLGSYSRTTGNRRSETWGKNSPGSPTETARTRPTTRIIILSTSSGISRENRSHAGTSCERSIDFSSKRQSGCSCPSIAFTCWVRVSSTPCRFFSAYPEIPQNPFSLLAIATCATCVLSCKTQGN